MLSLFNLGLLLKTLNLSLLRFIEWFGLKIMTNVLSIPNCLTCIPFWDVPKLCPV